MIEITNEVLALHFKSLANSGYMHCLFWLILLDIVSGYAKGIKNRKFDSKVGTNGLIRHFLVFSVMVLIGTYARALGYPNVSIGACVFFITNYSVSFIENWEALGLPFPDKLKPFFNQMRKESEDKLASNLMVDKLEVKEIEEKGD
ncbi:phage holin family protein [Hutsoniella sourekii]|uniref:phage holin family protein n=1 Tax=Hutsoniella sourekii TaxID=87650 RepID=UPI000487FDAA|nr:phage holin family protein [Hutsoniella sourekii]